MVVKLRPGFGTVSVCLVIVALGLTACGGQNDPNRRTQNSPESEVTRSAESRGKILIDGSSTVYPISNEIAKEYLKTSAKAVGIEVKFSGTSGGFKKFCAGEIDISNASRPILSAEVAACVKSGVAFIELPVAFDALTIVVNPQNTWAQDLTMAELKKMWEPAAEGKIKSWKQIRESFPDQPLKLFGAGKDSGTFDYFNDVTNGDASASRSDYSGSEDDADTVRGVESDKGALGYFGFAYYEENQARLKALAIDNGKGAVLPSREAVEKATYQPFSRPLFIYVNAKTAQDNPELKAFVEYYLSHAGRASKTVGYIPLPNEAYRLATAQFTRGKVGTVFEGVPQPNVTLAELLRRQAVFEASGVKTQP
ncbi:ABC transporter substrate-binding protein [Leptolyngbya sp. 'hensonii']|nr:ABC transporter substrate-binding protein [Leptolyngbya sp. 'hensonii']